MIKANEIRIGNWIEFNNFISPPNNLQVTPRMFRQLGMDLSENLDLELSGYHKPIPLTEEWLLKMGFEKSQEEWYTIKYFTDCDLATEQMAISYNLSSNRCAVFDAIEETDIVNILSYPIYTSKKVLYVHTLQNVFFALTGEELILDQNEVR